MSPVNIPSSGECDILNQGHAAVHTQPKAGTAFFDVEPAKDVDDAHHHVVDDLLPFGHAEVSLALDDPEGHGAPVGHDEDPEVKLEDWSEEGEGDGSSTNGEEVPEHLNNHGLVGHG